MTLTAAYVPTSIYGRTLDTDFTIGFRVHLHPAGTAESEGPSPETNRKTKTPTQPAGDVFLSVRMARPENPALLLIEANISTPQQGVYTTRAPTPAELKTLFVHWWQLRDAALIDAEPDTKAEAKALVATFAHAEAVIAATSWRTRPRYPEHPAGILLSGQNPTGRASPPIPDLPIFRPKPAKAPKTTPLQSAIQQAITAAEAELSDIGDGHAWAVPIVAKALLEAMAPHVKGLSPDAFQFGA